MTSTLSIHEDVLQKVLKSTKEKEFSFGLLLGQNYGSKKQHILHWCPTVISEDEEQPSSLQSLDNNIVAHHASQVVRMLPGGVSVIGVYLAWQGATSNTSDSARVTKLQKLFSSISRHITFPLCSSSQSSSFQESFNKLVLLSICNLKLKYSTQLFSCTSNSLPETVNMQVQADAPRSRELSFTYQLDLSLYETQKQGADSTELHLMLINHLKPWIERVCSSCLIVNGILCKHDDDTQIKDKFPIEDDAPVELQCRILEVSKESSSSNVEACTQDIKTTLELTGAMTGRAYLLDTCSVGSAVRAVQEDVCRSMCVRWGLHCDSLLEDTSAPALFHEPPRRVLFTDPSVLPMTVYDYLFPGDTADDACESIRELLGVTVPPECIDTAAEIAPCLESSPQLNSSGRGCSSSSSRSSLTVRPRHLQLAAGFALLAIILAYLYLKK